MRARSAALAITRKFSHERAWSLDEILQGFFDGTGETARIAFVLLLVLLTAGQLGCSGPAAIGGGTIVAGETAPPKEPVIVQRGIIGVTPTTFVKTDRPVDTSGMVQGRLEAVKLAGRDGFLVGGAIGLPLAYTGLVMCATLVGCIVGAPLAGAGLTSPIVGALGGTISGALQAESLDTIRSSEAAIERATTRRSLPNMFSERIAHSLKAHGVPTVAVTAPTFAPGASDPAPDSLLSTEVTYAGLMSSPSSDVKMNPPFRVVVQTQSRLRRVSDAVELSSHSVSYESVERPLTVWSQKDAELFRAEMEAAIAQMAQEIVDSLVLAYPLGVEPIAPTGGENVRTLKPVLAWKPFPEATAPPTDLDADRLRIANTSFEVKVFDGGRLIYRRDGLDALTHQVDESIVSCEDLQWQVRARFELAGQIRVSHWSGLSTFETPCYLNPFTWIKKRERPSNRGEDDYYE